MGLDWLLTRSLDGLTPEETLRAPVVGKDKEADEFIAGKKARFMSSANEELRKYWSQPLEVLMKDHAGQRIVEATTYDLSREYPSEVNSKHPTAFHGGVLLGCGLDAGTMDEARIPHSCMTAMEYAFRLVDKAEKLPVEHQPKVLAASRWLKFWAARGHGFVPWE